MEVQTKRTLEIKILLEAEASKADDESIIKACESGEYAGESLSTSSMMGQSQY